MNVRILKERKGVTMVNEVYCSEEITRLLLKKGCPLEKVIVNDMPYPVYITLPKDDPKWSDADAYYIPSLAQVMGWLREVHHIHVCPVYNAFFQERPKKVYHHWCCNAVGIDRCFRQGVQDIRMLDPDYFFLRSCKTYHDTYEDACEETIEYCLKHLID